MIPNILTIAGSDPSGGAGIQADLKTFSALECYGMAALTALTAQNTRGVTGVHAVPAKFVKQQLETIFNDVRVDAVKIGMAGSPDVIHSIAEILKKYKPPFIVLDPVMVAQSGDALLSAESVESLQNQLIPLATLITPNIPEAQILLGLNNPENLDEVAKNLFKKYKNISVLLKGGHENDEYSTDILVSSGGMEQFKEKRISTKNNHGTGCTLSAAIAAFLARGCDMNSAVYSAKKYVTRALEKSGELSVGGGAGPVHHFFDLWEKPDA